MHITLLITTAALLVIATIVVSLSTASDLQRQRRALAALEQAYLGLEKELEVVEAQRKVVEGTLALHQGLLAEKRQLREQLTQDLEWLKEDRVSAREIKTAQGARQRNFDLGEDA